MFEFSNRKNNSEDFEKQAYKCIENDNYTGAVENFSNAIKLNPSKVELYNNRSYAYNCLKDYDNAILDINKAIKLMPEYAILYDNRGAIYEALNANEKAVEDYTQAINLEPSNSNFYHDRAIANFNIKDANNSLFDIDSAIKLDAENDVLYNFKCRIYDELLDDKVNAVKAISKAIEICDDYYEYYYIRGSLYAELNNDAAIKDFEKCIELNPEQSYIYLKFGLYYAMQGNFDKAKSCFDKAIELEPNDGEIYYYRGKLNLHDDNNKTMEFLKYFSAISDFDKSIELGFKCYKSFIARADANHRLVHNEEAINDALTAIEYDDSQAEPYWIIGHCNFREGSLQEAIRYFSKAIDKDNQDFRYYFFRGLSYSNLDFLGEYKYAISDYTSAISLKDTDALIYLCRGDCYLRISQKQLAYDDYIKSIKLDPHLTDAYISLANYYIDDEDDYTAVDVLTEGIKKNKKNKKIHELYYKRGKVLLNLDEYEDAISDFENAKELNDDEEPNSDYFYKCGLAYEGFAHDLYETDIDKASEYIEIALDNYNSAYEISKDEKIKEQIDEIKNFIDEIKEFQEELFNAQQDYDAALHNYVDKLYDACNEEDYSNALGTCKKAMEELGDDVPILLKYMGFILYKIENYEEAINYLEKCIKENAKPDASVYYYNACCNYYLGDFDIAIENCGIAIEIESDYSKAYFIRALSYKEVNMTNEALYDIETVIRLEPNNKIYLEERDKIINL